MLKGDLHLHSKEDSQDKIPYTAKELIDEGARQGLDVMSLTMHETVYYPQKLVDYASKKGILLIPGCEMKVEKRHILIYNKDAKKLAKIVDKIQKVNQIDKIAEHKQDSIVMAPHPYFVNPLFFWKVSSIGKILEKNINTFDAIEYSHFYYRKINLNKKAVSLAKKYKKPLIGSSDLHRLYHFGYTNTLIDANKDIDSVFEAIRKRKVKVNTRSLPLHVFIWLGILNALELT